MPNLGTAAGNFMLCIAVLLAGGSATKVFRIFSHMGLSCVSLNTLFKFQRVSLFQCWSRVPVKSLSTIFHYSTAVCLHHQPWILSSPYYSMCAGSSVAYEKLYTALTKNSLVKGIKQASPFAQTSCLEGFHSLLNQFAPKMIAYSYVGRRILAGVHFNFNFNEHREVKCRESDGTEQWRVSYPKFKNGEATVRDVKITPNFEYVEELFQTCLSSSKDEFQQAARKLRNMTPAPINTMLQKQPREEAIAKTIKRSKMVETDFPTTSTLGS
ncbi:unnamed protein product [Porites evermanni]|uniref:Uncharacterized protein n=1 Tax=Porites evermanni TaxID=104178 RepID=A0ABN8MGN7_9CNID|nr:unnamed protein product [Porites evermanni]